MISQVNSISATMTRQSPDSSTTDAICTRWTSSRVAVSQRDVQSARGHLSPTLPSHRRRRDCDREGCLGTSGGVGGGVRRPSDDEPTTSRWSHVKAPRQLTVMRTLHWSVRVARDLPDQQSSVVHPFAFNRRFLPIFSLMRNFISRTVLPCDD